MDQTILYSDLVRMGISRSYASQIAGRTRAPSLKLAIRIWRTTGHALGALKGASPLQIKNIAAMNGFSDQEPHDVFLPHHGKDAAREESRHAESKASNPRDRKKLAGAR